MEEQIISNSDCSKKEVCCDSTVVAGLYKKAQQCEVPGARPAGLRGHPGPRATRSRPRNDFRNKPLTGYRNKYISQNFMIRGIFTERKEIV